MWDMSIYEIEARCPLCGSAQFWPYGLVFHSEWIHIRLRNQADGRRSVQELATIIKRTWGRIGRKTLTENTHGE